MRKKCLVGFISLIIFCGCDEPPERKKINSKHPNIVFILADDLGISDLPSYGNSFNEAPNIARLESQGVKFTNAYAAPVCSPTRASIQTGQVPARVGITDWIPGHWRPYEEVLSVINRTQQLPEDVSTIGEMLSASGYRTGYFGKWHLGKKTPNERGYHEAVSSRGGPYYQGIAGSAQAYDNERVSDALTRMGIEFMERHKDNPFFLFISHFDVHVQLDADKGLIEKYKNKPKADGYPSNAVYAAMIEHMDKSVGDVMDYLEKAGLADNTIVIFYSDNGGLEDRFDGVPLLAGNALDAYPEGHPLTYIASSNAPYRGGKGSLFEGGVRVPMIVKWPGVTKSGSTYSGLASSVDFFPTIADFAGTDVPKDQIIDGYSLVPALKSGQVDTSRELFIHYPVYHHDIPKSALRKGDWKLVENLVNGEFELYNLKYDQAEEIDLVVSYPKKVEELKEALKKWQLKTNANAVSENPDFDPELRYEWGKHPDRE